MKFAHLADTHIKNLKYHYEYKEVFKRLYDLLRKEKVDYIIHCGDIAHTKTQISPEFVELCSDFFRNLASIAPTYIILGNHDGNLKNSSRQDALTPIVEALDLPDLHLLKKSGETVLNSEFTLNVLSVFDEDNWTSISDSSRINIALYHGSVSGCETDLGWKMEYGENDISIFSEFDYAFLGDIHKTNQVLDKKGRIRYAGSTVQQNHGETNDKGYLIWDIENKDSFTCKHVVLKNPKPFITIELTPRGGMPNKINISPGSRLRLVSNNNLPLDIMKKAVEVAKHKFNPESITFLNRAIGERGNVEDLTSGLANENFRDPAVQEELIEEYLRDYQPNEDLLKRVLRLNSKYNGLLEEKDEVNRNVNWKLESIEWDNLFNYGEENKINFANKNGIVGVFGKNFSGKSSIIDTLLYTLFNSTSKNERKNINIINQNKESCSAKLNLSIGDKKYIINRNSEKYIKRLKGDETTEAKTIVDFEMYDHVLGESQSLNGLSSRETDKVIRKHLGTLEDFLLTSMSSQLGSLAFISEGSTKRKEILAKFLDLEVFERKFKLAKDDAVDLRGALKRLEGKDFSNEIMEAQKNLLINEKETTGHKEKCELTKDKIKDLMENIKELDKKIESIPAEVIDINKVSRLISSKESEANDLVVEIVNLNEKLFSNKETLKKIINFISEFSIDEIKEKKEILIEKQEALSQLANNIKNEELKLKNQSKKAKLLKEVPCGSEYSHCKFIKDAYIAIDSLSITKGSLEEMTSKEKNITEEVCSLSPEKVDEHLQKYDQLLTKKTNLESDIRNSELAVEKNNMAYKSLERELENLQNKRAEYYENRDIIDNKESFIKKLSNVKEALLLKEGGLQKCENEMLQLYKEHGSLEQKLNSLEEQKNEMLTLQEEYSAYDLFMHCMHSSGISYDIIKKKLPVINNEIAKVLANIVDFEIFFEDDGKHLKIFIKHPKHEPRPLEMGSGAEKTIAAMAIRLALLSVSSLPKSDIFILDEPGTSLDAENMDGFVAIMEIVKSYFKTVLLISHLDSLKDCVDMEITIDKIGDYARVCEN